MNWLRRLFSSSTNSHTLQNGGSHPELNAQLMDEVRKGNELNVETILNRGANADMQTAGGDTPLIIASYLGHTKIVHMLLRLGASVNSANSDGQTAIAYASMEGHASVVRALLASKPFLETVCVDGMTPLMQACSHGHLEIVVALLEAGANVNKETKVSGFYFNALSFAEREGNKEIVSVLRSAGARRIVHKV